MPKENDLRVWWNRNGINTYHVVNSVESAKRLISICSTSDLANPNVEWNAGGLEVFENGEWVEYYDEDGRDIMEIMDEEAEML